MHGVIEPEQDLVKLTSDDVQQNCAKCTKPLPFLALRQRLPTPFPTGTNPRISGAKYATRLRPDLTRGLTRLGHSEPASERRPYGLHFASCNSDKISNQPDLKRKRKLEQTSTLRITKDGQNLMFSTSLIPFFGHFTLTSHHDPSI
jgi:hypothetical protein